MCFDRNINGNRDVKFLIAVIGHCTEQRKLLQPYLFCPIDCLLLMSNKNLSFFSIQTSLSGCSTAPICVHIPPVSLLAALASQGYFFCPVYCLLLMSNRNLSFLPFKHPIGGGQLPKNVCKILQSLAEHFLAARGTFFVRSIVCF